MRRRRFLGRSMTTGIALGGAAASPAALNAQQAQPRPASLPARFTPTAYSNPPSQFNPFGTPDYYTYADDLVIERNVPGKPHQGKVLAAIQAHSDDIPLFAGGLVAKLVDEGYTAYLIRISNDESAGRTLGHGVVQNEIDNQEVAKALGCKKAFSFYYRNHRMDDCAEIEIRARLIFLFRVLQVNTMVAMDPYNHYDENPDHLVAATRRRGRLLDGRRAEGLRGALPGRAETDAHSREVLSCAVAAGSQHGEPRSRYQLLHRSQDARKCSQSRQGSGGRAPGRVCAQSWPGAGGVCRCSATTTTRPISNTSSDS